MNQENLPIVEQFVEAEELAEALKGDRFKQFLDKIPIAILVAAMQPQERIIYANTQFQTLTGETAAAVEGKPWDVLKGRSLGETGELSQAIAEQNEHIGQFLIERQDGEKVTVEAYSNVIETDDGMPAYRVVALIAASSAGRGEPDDWEQSLRDKDFQLRELQHRVKNNLQMVTALIRLESRSWPDGKDALRRIAGRIESLQILYQCLSPDGKTQEVDLGAYLGQVAAAVIRSHASEGIHLALEVDVYPVSINIAMPAGLVVNELMTNALKHAFGEREGGTIVVQSLPDDEHGRKVVVADDGAGLPAGVVWPQQGKLSALFVQSFRDNANARVDVESSEGQGTRVTFLFAAKAKA